MRLPDWVWHPLERVYLAQRAIRRRELAAAVKREDRLIRAHFARKRAEHAAGECGGAAASCPFAPCRPGVDT